MKNAYIIIEDGEQTVWIARTMRDALEDAWTYYMRNADHFDENDTPEIISGEREFWETDILQSCSYVGEVGYVSSEKENKDIWFKERYMNQDKRALLLNALIARYRRAMEEAKTPGAAQYWHDLMMAAIARRNERDN